MASYYKIGENIYLPCREDNSLRVGFEPFKFEVKSPLDGVENGSCSAGGVITVNNQCLYYCKSNELEGCSSKKSCKPVNSKSEIPEWVKDTEGSCQYYSKKRSDLEKHLYCMHRTKYLNHCFRCTHCDFVAVDRIRAKRT